MIGLIPLGRSSRTLATISQATYEFFLVHGPIFLALAVYAHMGFWGTLLAGGGLAVLATIVLRRVARHVSNGIERIIRCTHSRPMAHGGLD